MSKNQTSTLDRLNRGTGKMSEDALQARLGQKAARFGDRRTKRNRTRGAQKARALREYA